MEFYEGILYFVIFLSVLNIIFRILNFFGHISSKKIRYLKVFTLVFSLFFQIPLWFVVSVAFIPLLLLFSYKFFVYYKNKSKYLEYYLSFIEKMTLKVQNQQSLLQSLRQLDFESDAFMQQNSFIKDRFVSFSAQKRIKLSKFQSSVNDKLTFLHQNPHQIAIYLEEWLKEEKQKEFFRHKSGQLSFQAKFQAFVVLGIYFTLFFCQVFFVDSQLTFKYFQWTLPLIVSSFYFMRIILRGFQWKV